LIKELRKNDFPVEKQIKSPVPVPLDYDKMLTSDLRFSQLNFGRYGLKLQSDFKNNYFDKIVASLFISYLFNPDEIIHDFYRMLKPNGLLLVSSMKPDSDISQIFTDYIDKVQHFDFGDTGIKRKDLNLMAAREMLNEAATLFELEEEGFFKFYSGEELVRMFKDAAFKDINVYSSLGNPPQAVIVSGKK
jgi:ubiquinone/menaquinone biosynthesis C-methylase UbiE